MQVPVTETDKERSIFHDHLRENVSRETFRAVKVKLTILSQDFTDKNGLTRVKGSMELGA